MEEDMAKTSDETQNEQIQARKDVARDMATTARDVARMQDALLLGLGVAQEVFEKSAKNTRKSLKRTQKQLGDVQDVVQDSVQSGLSKTQEVLGKGTKQASKSLMQATGNVMDMRDSLQDQYASYIRKRQRARMLFRWGLLTGIVLALLFTPIPGSQVRQRLAQQWERFQTSMNM